MRQSTLPAPRPADAATFFTPKLPDLDADSSRMLSLFGGLAIGLGVDMLVGAIARRPLPIAATLGVGAVAGVAGGWALSRVFGGAARAAAVAAQVADAPALLAQERAVMRQSPTSSRVLDRLDRDHVRLTVIDDATFERAFPGAGGLYDPRTHRIVIAESQIRNPVWAALLITHEGTHYIDAAEQHHFVGGTVSLLGAMGRGFASSALHLSNPLTGAIDEMWWTKTQTEANAYLAQGRAAVELGLDPAYGTFSDDGEGNLVSLDQTHRKLLRDDLYAMDGGRRIVMAGALGLAISLAASMGAAHVLAAMKVPHSAGISTVAGAALGVGLIAQDAVTHPNIRVDTPRL